MTGMIVVLVDVEDRTTLRLDAFNQAFYFETKQALKEIAQEAVDMVEIPFYTGELLSGFKISDIQENKDGFYDRKSVSIENTAPHAKFVQGPTRPHFVSFKKHPEVEMWAKNKITDFEEKNWTGLWVYRTQYPSESGGQFMTKIGQYVEDHAENRIRTAIDTAIADNERIAKL